MSAGRTPLDEIEALTQQEKELKKSIAAQTEILQGVTAQIERLKKAEVFKAIRSAASKRAVDQRAEISAEIKTLASLKLQKHELTEWRDEKDESARTPLYLGIATDNPEIVGALLSAHTCKCGEDLRILVLSDSE